VRPWRRASAWLAFLAPFFCLTYGAANAIAARRAGVSSIVFAWERHIPFLAWTIVPYWSIDIFYALSLFVCSTGRELDTHVRRLLTAQVVAVACFLLFPLTFTRSHPATHGLPGALFAALGAFDKPFNQAPSLHIALLIILWPLYAAHVQRARRSLHLWFLLVCVSVLTTYQHHFFDVPTGALLGVFCLWLWPAHGRSPIAAASRTTDRRRLTLAMRYLAGAAATAVLASWVGGAGWCLFWPAASLALVAANYAVIGAEGFQKDADGRMTLPARALFAPYLAAAWLNSRLWTHRAPCAVDIGDGVWLGRIPRRDEARGFAAVVDLSAELPAAATSGRWTCIPMLDLVDPPPAQLRDAADRVERARSRGPVLVCCALGYSRSAATVATWLMTARVSNTVGDAIERIRRAQPRSVIPTTLRAAIATAAEMRA
jgi:hypothetical protein